MTFDAFIKQYTALKISLPRHPTHSIDNENSDYVGYSYRCHNCFYSFDCVDCKNCVYCFDCVRSSDCTDSDYCVECELLYACVDCYRTYNSTYLDYCARLYDSHFCWDCSDGHDLFRCAHLKQKQYCIFNKQYTKDEYSRKIQELLKRPFQENLKELKKLITQYPFGPTNVTHSENSDYSNHVHYSKNCYLCFDTARSENCFYAYDSAYCTSSMDMTYCYKTELCYECSDTSTSYNCDYVEWSRECFDCSYLFNCLDCHYCFGCVNIKHKKYCILNKQYSEEEYKKTVGKIVASRQAVH